MKVQEDSRRFKKVLKVHEDSKSFEMERKDSKEVTRWSKKVLKWFKKGVMGSIKVLMWIGSKSRRPWKDRVFFTLNSLLINLQLTGQSEKF